MTRYMAALLAFACCLPANVSAQQLATVQGTIVDNSQGVLPGVTVTATETSTGRQLIALTDERGRYRFDNVNPGIYTLRMSLSGFATVEVARLELLVGTNATVPTTTMEVAALQETVVVTSESPLVDLTSSQVAGNIDRRQMEELPLQGRNWQELSLMVKGITANSVTEQPGVDRDDQFQLNLDGQQITQRVAGSGFGQPKISREAIAEFQIVTNHVRHHAGTVDRDAGAGHLSLGHERPAWRRLWVLPQRPLQRSRPRRGRGAAVLRISRPVPRSAARSSRDKAHFFGAYEYERQPADGVPSADAAAEPEFAFETKSTSTRTIWAAWTIRSSNGNALTVRGAAMGVQQPVPDRQRHGSPVARRTAHAVCDQRRRHLVPRRQLQARDGVSRRLQRLFLVQRCDPAG